MNHFRFWFIDHWIYVRTTRQVMVPGDHFIPDGL